MNITKTTRTCEHLLSFEFVPSANLKPNINDIEEYKNGFIPEYAATVDEKGIAYVDKFATLHRTAEEASDYETVMDRKRNIFYIEFNGDINAIVLYIPKDYKFSRQKFYSRAEKKDYIKIDAIGYYEIQSPPTQKAKNNRKTKS